MTSGLTHVCREVWLVRVFLARESLNYPRVQRSLDAVLRNAEYGIELPTFAVEFVNTKSS